MTTTSSPSDRQLELAQLRTDEAVRRTLLAEQRTYSAWIRTGLAAAATGFAVFKLLGDEKTENVSRLVAVVLIVAGAVMFVVAFWAYRGALAKLNAGVSGGVPVWILGLISTALFTCCALCLILVFQS